MTRPLAGLSIALTGSALSVAVIAMVSSVAVAGVPDGLFGAALAFLALIIAIGDARTFRIPDPLNAGLFVLGLIAAGAQADALVGVTVALARGFGMAAVIYAFRWLYARLRGVEGLGLGDVKLAAGAGAWLQVGSLPWAVEFSAVAGLVVAFVASRVSTFQLNAGARLPFGAFFAPAIWLCWLAERLGWI